MSVGREGVTGLQEINGLMLIPLLVGASMKLTPLINPEPVTSIEPSKEVPILLKYRYNDVPLNGELIEYGAFALNLL